MQNDMQMNEMRRNDDAGRTKAGIEKIKLLTVKTAEKLTYELLCNIWQEILR